MTNEEAIAIIRKEYLCVDRDCDIERSCGKCDLAMPSKEPILEAFKMAIKALETIPKYKDAYGKGWDDGAKATYEHLKMCEEEQSGDLISRDAVLDVIEGWLKCSDYNEAERHIMRATKSILYDLPSVNSQEPKTGHCKDCKWWKDSDGVFRRGIGAESQCPMNRIEVFEGNGYCYMFEPQESEDNE